MIKNSIRFIFVSVATLSIGSVYCEDKQQAGATASINHEAILSAKDNYYQALLDFIGHIEIDKIDLGDAGYCNEDTIKVTENSDAKFIITPDSENNGFDVKLRHFEIVFKSENFRYKYALSTAKGTLEAKIEDMKLEFFVSMDTQTDDDGNLIPAISVKTSEVTIDNNNVVIKIEGNSDAWFLNALANTAKGQVTKEIVKELTKELEKSLPKSANKAIKSAWGETEIVDGVTLDWYLSYPPLVTDEALELGINGIINDVNITSADQDLPFIPAHDSDSSSLFQVFISDMLLNSALDAVVETGKVTYYIKSGDIDKMDMTTESLDRIFAGIQAAYSEYGDSLPVDFEATVSNVGDIQTHEDLQDIDVTANLTINLWVNINDEEKVLAAELSINDAKVNVSASVANNTDVLIDITDIQFDHVIIDEVNFDTTFDFATLAVFIESALKLAIPAVLRELNEFKIEIPGELFGMYNLTDLTLNFADDYIEAGLTPVLIKDLSSFVPEIQEDTDFLSQVNIVANSLNQCEPCRGVVNGDFTEMPKLMEMYSEVQTAGVMEEVCNTCIPLFKGEVKIRSASSLFLQ